jgi:hypothetical protein
MRPEKCIMSNFIIVLFTRYYWADQIKEDDVQGLCNTNGRDVMCIESFSWKKLREETA